MSDDASAVAAAADAILAATVTTEPGCDAAAWRALDESGLTTILLPESAGGGGGGLAEAAEVVRAVGRHAAAVPVVAATLLAPFLLERSGLPMPAGPVVVADGRGAVLATETDGRWSLTGPALQVPYARHAGSILLVADPGVVVLLDPAAASIEDRDDAVGEPRDLVSFKGVTATGAAADLDGYDLRAALGRLLLAAGAAEAVQELTLRQVREREQFGRPIVRFQAVQHLVAELAGEVTALSVAADAAVALLDTADDAWLAVAAAAIDGDASMTRIAAIAHQLHGAIGTTHEHGLHRFTTRLWSWRADGGTSTAWSTALAGRLLAPDRPEIWEQIAG